MARRAWNIMQTGDYLDEEMDSDEVIISSGSRPAKELLERLIYGVVPLGFVKRSQNVKS